MSESKIKEEARIAAGLPDPKQRDDHLNQVLADIHDLTAKAGITHNEAVELYFRAMLGVAYDADGNMTSAIDHIEEYLLGALTTIRTDAQPRITHIVERGKLYVPH